MEEPNNLKFIMMYIESQSLKNQWSKMKLEKAKSDEIPLVYTQWA